MMSLVKSTPKEGSSIVALPAYSRPYLTGTSACVSTARTALPDGWVEALCRIASGNGAFVAGGAAGATTYGRATGGNNSYGTVSVTVMLLPSKKDHAATVTLIQHGAATGYRTRHRSWIMTAVSGWEAA